MGVGIGSWQWLHWKHCSLHTAAVRCPPLMQMWVLLPQVMKTAAWIHWLGVFRCRLWEFSTWFRKASRFSHTRNWSLVQDRLHGQLVSVVRDSLLYLCWTRPHSPLYVTGIWPPSSVGTVPVAVSVHQSLSLTWDLGRWWGRKPRDLRMQLFAQERAKPCQSIDLSSWVGELVVVIQVYLHEDLLLPQLPPLFPACLSWALGW